MKIFFLNWQTFLIVTGLSKYLEGFNYSYTATLNICRHENNHDNVFFNNCFFSEDVTLASLEKGGSTDPSKN